VGQLTTYITQLQRILHDPNDQMWPQSEKTDYINEARNRVAQDTKCLRQLVTNAATGLTLTANVELYVPQTYLPAAFQSVVVDVMAITVYWGNSRRKLKYYEFTGFDVRYRMWNLLVTVPEAFSRVSPTQVYIGPMPDQSYATDWELAINPNALPFPDVGAVDQIPVPYQEAVQYYAAYKAKFKEQSLGEADVFLKHYVRTLNWCHRSWMTRQVQNPYSG
jgi:hypothetical protein